jgi:hypothetical protein
MITMTNPPIGQRNCDISRAYMKAYCANIGTWAPKIGKDCRDNGVATFSMEGIFNLFERFSTLSDQRRGRRNEPQP